jgi:hypothetical protein
MPADGADVAALATRLRAEIGHAHVLTDRQELRTHECDGPAVHKVVQSPVALPENRQQVQAVELGNRTAAEVLDASLRGTPYRWSSEARAPTHQGG